MNQVSKYQYRFLLLCIVLFHFAVRIPTFFEPAYKDDPNFYLTVGRALLSGKVLFRDIGDFVISRPGLIYYLAGLCNDYRLLTLLTVVVNTASLILFVQIIRYCSLSRFIFLILSVSFVLFTSTPLLEGNEPRDELFVMLFSLAAIWMTCRCTKHQSSFSKCFLTGPAAFFIGVISAFGVLIKLSGVYDFIGLAIGLMLIQRNNHIAAFKSIVYVLLGFSFLITGYVFLLLTSGNTLFELARTMELTFTTVVNNNAHILPVIARSLHFKLAPAIIITLIVFLMRRKLSDKVIILVLWAVWSIIGSLSMHVIGLHYTLQAVPAVLFMVGILLSADKARQRYVAVLPIIVIVAAHLVYELRYPQQVIGYYKNFFNYASGKIDIRQYYQTFSFLTMRNYEIAQTIRALSSSGEEILVWGIYGEIYNLSGTHPAIKYVWHEHVERMDYYEEMLKILEDKQTRFIVVTRELPQENEQRFLDYVDANYTRYRRFYADDTQDERWAADLYVRRVEK